MRIQIILVALVGVLMLTGVEPGLADAMVAQVEAAPAVEVKPFTSLEEGRFRKYAELYGFSNFQRLSEAGLVEVDRALDLIVEAFGLEEDAYKTTSFFTAKGLRKYSWMALCGAYSRSNYVFFAEEYDVDMYFALAMHECIHIARAQKGLTGWPTSGEPDSEEEVSATEALILYEAEYGSCVGATWSNILTYYRSVDVSATGNAARQAEAYSSGKDVGEAYLALLGRKAS